MKLLSAIHGIGIVLAAAVGLLLATVLIDYICNLPATPRLIIIFSSLAVLVYALIRWIIKPISARLSLSDVAGRVEQAFPQFNDRLRSTVDFVQSDVPGSEAMKRRVVGEATDLASRLNLRRAVIARPAINSIAAGLGAILLACGLAILIPNYATIALSRLFTPFTAAAWPKRVQIQLIDDVPTRAAVGQHIDVKMKLARGDSQSRKASIFYQYDDGPVQREYMNRGEDGSYASSLDARVETGKLSANLRIWMEAGDDRMQLPPITVVPRLMIQSVKAQLSPPPYVSNQKTTIVDMSAAPAIVAEGARIILSVDFNKPLAKNPNVEILPASEEMHKPDVQWQQFADTNITATWTARQSLRFRIRATDNYHFTNNAIEEYEIIVRPYQSPTVQIENPRRNEERTAVSVVPLQGTADDDYGIDWLKLIVERASDKKKWEINLLDHDSATNGATATRASSAADRLRFSVGYQWDLSQLKDANLKPGDVLDYYLLVKDNFALYGQTHPPVPSGRLRIAIITQEELTDRVIDELRQIKNQITGVKSTVDRTHEETTGLTNDTKNKDQLDAADRAALDRLTNQQATSASQAKQIAAKVDSLRDRLNENKSPSQDLSDTARDVANDLNQAAENPMKEATNQLSSANQPNAKSDQRNQALAKAVDNQQQADQQLQQALDR
ncbi:MAG TPA: hypothetical protein VKK61_01625, partial [Tepidisphaeraceae bacterium]|nr:hypothetical protein [Tepidisphaeraceae bacterium]